MIYDTQPAARGPAPLPLAVAGGNSTARFGCDSGTPHCQRPKGGDRSIPRVLPPGPRICPMLGSRACHLPADLAPAAARAPAAAAAALGGGRDSESDSESDRPK